MSELFACRINKKEISTEWLGKMTITVWFLSPSSLSVWPLFCKSLYRSIWVRRKMPLLWRGKGSSFLLGEEAGAEAGRLHQQWPHRPGLSTVTSNNRIPVMSGRRKTSWILFRYVLGWSNEQPAESWGWRKRRKADFRNVQCQRNCGLVDFGLTRAPGVSLSLYAPQTIQSRQQSVAKW